MTNREHELAMHASLRDGNIDSAIEHATHLPHNYQAFYKIPSSHKLNDDEVRKVLAVLEHPAGQHRKQLEGFLYEYAHNPHPGASSELLRDLAHKSKHLQYVPEKLMAHPNYQASDQDKQCLKASEWWNSYETSPKPHHFATVKSMDSCKPEEFIDHRKRKGESDSSVLADLIHHKKAVQDAILNDKELQAKHQIKEIDGVPHILVHRGLSGRYSSAIAKAYNFDHETNTADDKVLEIPVAPMQSWTASMSTAERFAMATPHGTQGVIISKWLPVSDVLHSGYHTVVPGQVHTLPDSEKEVVIAHPEGRLRITPEDIKFRDHNLDPYDENATSPRPNFRKSEDYGEGYLEQEQLIKANKLVSAITAASMLGLPSQALSVHGLPTKAELKGAPVHAMHQKSKALDPALRAIAHIESSGGTNLSHKMVQTGLNAGTKAIGKFGLMPLQIMDSIKADPGLKRRYGHILSWNHKEDQDKIAKEMEKNPSMESDIVRSHWNRLGKLFDYDHEKMAHAWHNGITGTFKKGIEQIKSNPYVQKFNKIKKMFELERDIASTPKLHKAEEKTIDQEKFNVQKFLAAESGTPRQYIDQIQRAIASGDIHSLDHIGHFTQESFIAGSNPDQAWLIKLDPTNRPAVKSVQGSQVVKEAAFYEAAEKVFGLQDFTPKAIFGAVLKDKKMLPAVAIKMYGGEYQLAADIADQDKQVVVTMLEPYLQSGVLHKLAAMLYILGDADSHGTNIMTDGKHLRLIDHGTSFADMTFDPSQDPHIFIPYFLRVGRIKSNMSPQEKLDKMPTIKDPSVQEELQHWVQGIDPYQLKETVQKYGLDPKPVLDRLYKLQKLTKDQKAPDQAINQAWVTGLNEEVKDERQLHINQ